MYKQHLLLNIEREITLLKQLAPLIQEKDLDFGPIEKIRSTYELMQYLSNVGAWMMKWFIKNDITPEDREKAAEYKKTLTIENFTARLDEQLTIIRKYMDEVSEEELLSKEVVLPWKETMPLGAAIICGPIKWLTAYRMELFVYLKINGRPELSTGEAWRPDAYKEKVAQ